MNIPITHPEIDSPSSDGKPMAETPLHMRVMIDLIESLNAWYAGQPRVYVWGNLFVYYVLGDPTKSFSPDVMVVKGVAKNRPRDVFKIWEEGKAPSLIIEVSSRKTRKEDTQAKFRLYQDVIKVREYFLFDPKAEYVKPPLQGYRLKAGVYEPIAAKDDRLPSAVLGLHLERHGRELRLWNPDDKHWLPTPAEVIERTEKDKQSAELARREAEAASQEAEAEIERLKRELRQLRNGKSK